MAATRAENSHPIASIPALGFGVRAWCKSVIETSHVTASPSVNKIPRFDFVRSNLVRLCPRGSLWLGRRVWFVGNAQEEFDVSSRTRVDGVWSWTDDVHLMPLEGGENHASLSTCYVFCSHRSYDEPWLLDITSTSVAIIGLCSRTECPSRCEDRAAPPHHRPVHWRSRLQVRVVL
jgi:hypothetical protein